MNPEYDKLLNPDTFNTEPVYIFDLEMIPSPPGTPAAERPADRPRVTTGYEEVPSKQVLFIFDDRYDLPPPA